jgi:hypothetical protein
MNWPKTLRKTYGGQKVHVVDPRPAPDSFRAIEISVSYIVLATLPFGIPSSEFCTSQFTMEQRAVIRFLTLKGLGVQQIHSELESVYHKEVLTLSTVYKWSARFRVGRTKLSNDPRSRRPGKSDVATGISAMLEARPLHD